MAAKPETRDHPDVVGAFYHWVRHAAEDRHRPPSDAGFKDYFHGIAEARYVIRRVFRIADEQARSAGLEPLEHQALIQVFGAPDALRIVDVAERLDIAPAFASRLVKTLEAKNLVTRANADNDRRITIVSATDDARDLLAAIDENVAIHVGHFQRQLTDAERAAALGIFSFYLGASPTTEDLDKLIEILRVSRKR